MQETNETTLVEAARSRKRRKILRRRPSTDDGDSSSMPGVDDKVTTTSDCDNTPPVVDRVRRTRKHGIPFSSNDRVVRQLATTGNSTALARYEEPTEAVQDDRFVRATGRAMVLEDKHMSEFIDAKMAEICSNTITPVLESDDAPTSKPQSKQSADSRLPAAYVASSERSTPGTVNGVVVQPIVAKNDKHRHKHRKRQVAMPLETDIARDGLVDQFMREGALLIYDNQASDVAKPNLDDDHDNDAAAVVAFKADFLATMEEKRYSRKPINATSGPNGPKLGGSRMARERMKALEEQTKTTTRSDQR